MRICKVENCNKKHYARGYCINHWRIIWYFEHKKERRAYRIKYWKEHYIHKLHKCKAKDCLYKTWPKYKYCKYHKARIKAKLPLDLSIDCRSLRKGEKNNLWKGGIAEYPNHYLMKKNRLIILLHNPVCEICKEKPAVEIHHKNGDKSDNRLSNLAASCHKCNSGIRFKPNNLTDNKLIRKYGLSYRDFFRITGLTNIYRWHKEDILSSIIASNPFYFCAIV